MAPLHSTSGMMALLRKAARLPALLALVLLVAVGTRPAPAMTCGDVPVAAHMMASAVPHPHAAPDVPSAHETHLHGDAARAADAGHGSAGHDHAQPCCHTGCPACLAQVPAAPLAVRMVADPAAIALGATPLPAGIVLAPPRAPPKAA
ncbi:hypothetical protein [Azorhizobium doebereinerae]|uniref:hypothetical protein n=1 Tax=Azorhizobium doebereinerae TaxID=281091 RepID=UPI0004143ACC|nr:hypothetical protein [Azorhizobium doebereinerae]